MSESCSAPTSVARRPRTLVTGAAVRVGRATAIEFAQRGHDVVLAVRAGNAHSQESLQLVRAAAREAGHCDATVEVRAADLDDPVQVVALGATFARENLDVVIHCASRYEPQRVGAIDAEHALSHYRINALAPLLLTQSLQAQLTASVLPAGGAVICFCDMHAQGRMYAGHAAYFASKGALEALVGALAVELAPKVRVNGIAPGVVEFPVGADRGFQERYIERTPLKRAGTPAEAANCAAWLALDASFVTGTILRLDGGRWLST